jgi:hypothetical protein
MRDGRVIARPFLFGLTDTSNTSLISVLVTEIQPAQVLGLKGLFRRADARLLDSCDKHRNEGEIGVAATPHKQPKQQKKAGLSPGLPISPSYRQISSCRPG